MTQRSGGGDVTASAEVRSYGWVWTIVLVAIVLLVYGRSVFFGFLVFDDHTYILQNPTIVQPSMANPLDLLLTPQMRYIIPLTVLPQAVMYQLGSGSAWPFHAANVLLHVTYVLLIFRLARSLGAPGVAAWAAAFLVAVHPMCAEPVAWATGFKDVLMATLAIAATICLVRVAAGGVGRRWSILAVVLALGAALAKPSALILGLAWAAWLVVRWAPWRAGAAERSPPGLLRTTVVVTVALEAALSVANYIMYSTLIRRPDVPVEGAFKPLLALGWQVHHALWPTNLHPIYPVDRAAGFDDVHTWIGLVAVLLVVAGLWFARRRADVFLAMAFAIAMYLPASNLLPFPRFLADSYLYGPLAGIAVALALACRRWAVPMGVVVGALCVVLAWVSFGQVGRWENGRSLWGPLRDAHPSWSAGYFNLGHAHFMAGESDAAVDVFTEGFDVGYDPEALGNFAISLDRMGRLDDAECVFTEAAIRHGSSASLRNLSVFAARNPDLEWRRPAHVRSAIDAWVEQSAGRSAVPLELRPGFARAQARLQTPQPVRAGGSPVGSSGPLCRITGEVPRLPDP